MNRYTWTAFKTKPCQDIPSLLADQRALLPPTTSTSSSLIVCPFKISNSTFLFETFLPSPILTSAKPLSHSKSHTKYISRDLTIWQMSLPSWRRSSKPSPIFNGTINGNVLPLTAKHPISKNPSSINSELTVRLLEVSWFYFLHFPLASHIHPYCTVPRKVIYLKSCVVTRNAQCRMRRCGSQSSVEWSWVSETTWDNCNGLQGSDQSSEYCGIDITWSSLEENTRGCVPWRLPCSWQCQMGVSHVQTKIVYHVRLHSGYSGTESKQRKWRSSFFRNVLISIVWNMFPIQLGTIVLVK